MSGHEPVLAPAPATAPPLPGTSRVGIAIQTALQLIPGGIGSAIAMAIFGTMAARQQVRVEAIIASLGAELARFENKIDVTYFATDEFQSIFRKCIEAAARDHHEMKREAVRNVLARNIVEGRVEAFDLDSYVIELIGSLTPLHLACLSALTRPVTAGTPRGEASGFHMVKGIADALQLDGDADLGFLEGVLAHLKSLGLVYGEPGAVRIGSVPIACDISFRISPAGSRVLRRLVDLDNVPPDTGEHEEQEANASGA